MRMTNWAARAPRSTVVEEQETSGQDTLAWACAPLPPAYWLAMSLFTWLMLSLISPESVKMRKWSSSKPKATKNFKNILTQDDTVPPSPNLLDSSCTTPLSTLQRSHFAEKWEIRFETKECCPTENFTYARPWRSSWCPSLPTQARAGWPAQHSPLRLVNIASVITVFNSQEKYSPHLFL